MLKARDLRFTMDGCRSTPLGLSTLLLLSTVKNPFPSGIMTCIRIVFPVLHLGYSLWRKELRLNGCNMHQYAMCFWSQQPTPLEALKTFVPSEASGRQRHLVRSGSRNVGKWRKQCRNHILAIVLFVGFLQYSYMIIYNIIFSIFCWGAWRLAYCWSFNSSCICVVCMQHRSSFNVVIILFTVYICWILFIHPWNLTA